MYWNGRTQFCQMWAQQLWEYCRSCSCWTDWKPKVSVRRNKKLKCDIIMLRQIRIEVRLESEQHSVRFSVDRIFRCSLCVVCLWIAAARQGDVWQWVQWWQVVLLSVVTVTPDVQSHLDQLVTITCRSSKCFMKQNMTIERFINFQAWCSVVTIQ